MSPPGAGTGRETTLAAFARAHTVGLTRFAFLLCGDRGGAEDLVQDAYLALYRRFGERLPLDAPLAYARRAVLNGAVSRRRRRAGHEIVLADLPETPVRATPGAAEDGVWHTLAGLPARQRAVLVLRYYLDLPDREIADLLGCREGTVRSLASRAFGTLRAHPDVRPRADHPDHQPEPEDDR